MNMFEFSRRYGTAYVIVGSLAICAASVFYSAIEPTKNWGFLIWPIGYIAFVHDVGYKDIYKVEQKKSLFVIFFLVPWLISAGFTAYRAIIKLGLT